MAWTATVTLDPDKNSLVTATATFDLGLPTEVTYQRRANITNADQAQFVADAKAALAAFQSTRTVEANYSAILTAAMNQ